VKNCLHCGHVLGTEAYLVLEGRFNKNGEFEAVDDTGFLCGDCIEFVKAGELNTLKIGGTAIRVVS